MHWLACSLYVACRKSSLPTVGRQQVVEGNCVSLTRLLRSCRLSLIQFFNKARKWADMSNLKKEMREKIDKVRNTQYYGVYTFMLTNFYSQPVGAELCRF